jgi:Raf kinase inhibitor-like YbhB/YbcL family protein
MILKGLRKIISYIHLQGGVRHEYQFQIQAHVQIFECSRGGSSRSDWNGYGLGRGGSHDPAQRDLREWRNAAAQHDQHYARCQWDELTWKHAPDETRSFMVIVYDVTAQFTHWAIYNIPAGTTSLPENAGIADSGYGIQNGNDFFSPGYAGPCPPKTLQPFVHEYAVTVYALDVFLPIVKTFGDFVPAGPEGLYHELIDASRSHHVLASATIRGHFSAVAPPNN